MILGFAGAGNMAGAMARGWAGAEGGPEGMLFCDLDRERAAALAGDVGGETRESLAQLGLDSDVVVLAVKPAALDDVAAELSGHAAAVLSVLAATSTERLAAAFPGTPILRVMPNQPVEVRRGVLCRAAAREMPAELEDRLVALLAMLGTVVALPEEGQMEAAMAVMSCAPAYAALFAEALADAGAREGLDPAAALSMVAGTLSGTAELLARRDPADVRRAVAPPGGATEAGLRALERDGFVEALDSAVEASLERFR
jgi:pyrroline-5-carboxylate reductase